MRGSHGARRMPPSAALRLSARRTRSRRSGRLFESASAPLILGDVPDRPLASSTVRALRSVTVDLGDRSYPVEIGAGTLAELGARVAVCTGARRAVVITVPPVARRYAAPALRSLRAAGLRAARIEVPDGDASKSLRQLERLYHELLAVGADRHSVLVALGGGAV